MITLAFPYHPPPPPPADWRSALRGRVAAYALGPDYHDRLSARLARLIERLRGRWPQATFRPYVDTGPVLEREWAMRGGIGWIGRNTMVLHRHAGSYFFLAELLTDLALAPTALPADHCGTCTRCLERLPDRRAHRLRDGSAALHLVPHDRASHRHPARPPPRDRELDLRLRRLPGGLPVERATRAVPRDDALAPSLPDLLALDAAGFAPRFGGTAVARAKRRGLLRNVAVALGNSGNPAAVPSLVAALDDRRAAGARPCRLGAGPPRRARAARRARPGATRIPSVRAEADVVARDRSSALG